MVKVLGLFVSSHATILIAIKCRAIVNNSHAIVQVSDVAVYVCNVQQE
jgi:hypothetical protein